MNWTSATASATDNTSMGRTECMPSTVEGNVISYSANGPLLLCLPVVAQQASTALLPGNKKTDRASIPTEEGPTKKKETLIQESPTQGSGVPTEEVPATDEDIMKQKATRATFSSHLQCPSIEKSPDQEADMPTKEASVIKKNVVVLERATQGADLPVEGPVIEKKDILMPESPVHDFADMPTIEEPRKKRVSEEKEATVTPKKKSRGRAIHSKKYTNEERERLFKAVSDQSGKSASWEIVKQNFEATAPPGAPCRSTESLMWQFRAISASLGQKFERGKNYTDEERTRRLKTVGDETTTKEDVVVLESSVHKPDKKTGEDPAVKNKDIFILERPAEKNGMPRAAEEEAVTASQKKKHRGKNYTYEEQERLLKAVDNVRPTTGADWEIVRQNFEAAAPPGAPYRSAKALRQKFNGQKWRLPGGMRSTEKMESAIEKRPVQDTDLITGVDAAKTKDSGLIEESSARATHLTTEGNPMKEKAAHSIENSPAQEAGRPREEDCNAKKRAIQEAGEEVAPPKKRHCRGTAMPYTEEEKERLLDAVANVKPTLSGTWEQVKQHFDEKVPSDLYSDAPIRSCMSLRNIFANIANSIVMDALSGKPYNINLTGNPLGAETLTSKSKPVVDNAAVGDTPVYNDQVGEEPVGDESFCSDPRRVSMDRLLEERTCIADANSGSISRDGTNSKPPEAIKAPSDDDTMGQEAERLSDAMISFFERFSADDGMIVGNECRDVILSRLYNIERKVEMILSSVQSKEALERDKQWIL